MISENNKQKLESHLLEMGYSVLEWGEPSEEGIYRPDVTNLKGNKNNNLAVIPTGETLVLLHDHAHQIMQQKIIDISDGKEAKSEVIKQIDWSKLEAEKKRRVEAFNESFNSILPNSTEPNTHIVATEKKLNLVNAFVKNDQLYIPFKQTKDGLVTGAQVRKGAKAKWMLPNSTVKAAFNILNEGEIDKVLNTRVGYLAESYTTACEVLEACPDNFVACCAGIGQLQKTRDALMKEYPELFLILVCDKSKSNIENKAEDKLMEDLTQFNIPYIQLNKLDPKLAHMTDFNDYALAYGKYAVKKEIAIQSNRLTPRMPEIVGHTAKTVNLISPIDGKLHEIDKRRALDLVWFHAAPAFWDKFKTLLKGKVIDTKDGTKTCYKEALSKWIMESAVRNGGNTPKGIGIFKENNKYIANLQGSRYMSNGEMLPIVEMRPAAHNLYVTIDGPDTKDFSTLEFKKDHIIQLLRDWRKLLALPESTCLGVLGWAVQACYAPFSSFRAHLWLVGPSGSGKSTILNHFINKLFKGITLMVQDATTAGIGQSLTSSDGTQHSPVICLDEAGSDSLQKKKRMAEIIQLARDSAAADEDTISLRGTQEQDARTYRKLVCLALSSVECSLDDLQDLSRFILIDIAGAINQVNAKDFKEVQERIKELNPYFLHLVVKMAPYFEQCVEETSEILYSYLGSKRSILSQKIRALSSCVAGTSLIHYYLNKKSIKDSVEDTFNTLKPFIDKIVTQHIETFDENYKLIDDLCRFKYKDENNKPTRLLDTLITELDFTDKPMWVDYGIKVVKQDSKHYFVIRKDNFSLTKLVHSSLAASDKLLLTRGKLNDLVQSGTIQTTKARGKNKTYNCFKMEVPEEFLSIGETSG